MKSPAGREMAINFDRGAIQQIINSCNARASWLSALGEKETDPERQRRLYDDAIHFDCAAKSLAAIISEE